MSEDQKSGDSWWGSTLGKLKSALAKTKEAVVDSVVERENKIPETLPTPQAVNAQSSENRQTASEFNGQGLSGSTVVTAPNAVQAATRLPVAIDEDYLEDLEEKLIRADLGLATVELLTSDLRKQAKANRWNSNDVESFLKVEFAKLLASTPTSKLNIGSGLTIILVVGVNGTGKTTSIGKLCHRLKKQGKKVLMAAGDTFRAAAETQLEIWADRAQVDIVRLPDGSDPGAVVYQAIKKAQDESYDVLVIDTAGRLHNKTNLMAELKKVRTVIDKNASNSSTLEALLVLDASIGQNGLQQAKVFAEVCGLTGVIVTKLDGTAKGGVIFTIANELRIPVKLIGLGEQIDDLRDFEPELFVEALFA